MASRHPRVQVPVDPEVAHAIAEGRRLVGEGAPASQILRALVLRGAQGLEADHEAQRAGREFLVSVADGASGLDLDALRTVRERAWR